MEEAGRLSCFIYLSWYIIITLFLFFPPRFPFQSEFAQGIALLLLLLFTATPRSPTATLLLTSQTRFCGDCYYVLLDSRMAISMTHGHRPPALFSSSAVAGLVVLSPSFGLLVV